MKLPKSTVLGGCLLCFYVAFYLYMQRLTILKDTDREKTNDQNALFPSKAMIRTTTNLNNTTIHSGTTEIEAQELPKNWHKRNGEESGNPQSSSRNSTTFRRYDDVGPKILRSQTHYLSLIPSYHRLELGPKDILESRKNTTKFDSIVGTSYAADPSNVYPQKIHLFEFNPSITVLPIKYQKKKAWIQALSGKTPIYLASYRIGHRHSCFSSETSLQLWGGSWKNREEQRKTDYLGLAVLDANLTILVETIVDLQSIRRTAKYQDFRLMSFGENVYLSSQAFVTPILLSLIGSEKSDKDKDNEGQPKPDDLAKGFVEIPPAFESKKQQQTKPRLRVYLRRPWSCPVGKIKKQDKNLLYFAAQDTKNNSTITTTTTTTATKAKVLFNPKTNDFRTVHLDQKCQQFEPEDPSFQEEDSSKVPPSFETIEAMQFPDKDLFQKDSGSACCSKILANAIRNKSINFTTTATDEDDQSHLLVAMVHTKTYYPGTNLPASVVPNTYLSRFVAFLPHEPHKIVARSGLFCLGYPQSNPTTAAAESMGRKLLEFSRSDPLLFGDEKYNCPRIHFVMGMVDVPPSTTKESGNNGNADDYKDGSVVISYGIGDCLSQFVEIPKAEIVRLLNPPDHYDEDNGD